jgi:hypothetical protein
VTVGAGEREPICPILKRLSPELLSYSEEQIVREKDDASKNKIKMKERMNEKQKERGEKEKGQSCVDRHCLAGFDCLGSNKNKLWFKICNLDDGRKRLKEPVFLH